MEDINIYDLEKKLIPMEHYESQVPHFVLDKIDQDDFLHPVGVGYDDDIGWFILGMDNSLYIIWREY